MQFAPYTYAQHVVFGFVAPQKPSDLKVSNLTLTVIA